VPLTITRRDGQSVRIGPDITVTFHAYRGHRARLTIDAPPDVLISRDAAEGRVDDSLHLADTADDVGPDKPAPSGTALLPRHFAELENPIDVYLTAPYGHRSPTVRNLRYLAVLQETARLTNEGLVVYAPIIHAHELYNRHRITAGDDVTLKRRRAFLLHARELRVLKLPGWAFAPAVQAEAELAEAHHIPVLYIDPLPAAK